jgi:hypothetical protein
MRLYVCSVDGFQSSVHSECIYVKICILYKDEYIQKTIQNSPTVRQDDSNRLRLQSSDSVVSNIQSWAPRCFEAKTRRMTRTWTSFEKDTYKEISTFNLISWSSKCKPFIGWPVGKYGKHTIRYPSFWREGISALCFDWRKQ